MAESTVSRVQTLRPRLADVVELSKPVTWFPPMWAFLCGVVSSGAPIAENWLFLVAGMMLCGPLVCGTSQVVNDWHDRHVDAINEPGRPIPSGRVPGRWPVAIALAGAAASLALAAALGPIILLATAAALFSGWAYSAPPLRLKRSGVLGPLACALSYEGLSWFTGASVMLGGLPDGTTMAVLLLYSLGAFGIMTLNDFKAIEGDRATGLRSLPVMIGVRPATLVACAVMAIAQAAVVALLIWQGLAVAAGAVALSLAIQLVLMRRMIADPAKFAPWYNATGVSLYVLGMLAAAIGLGGYL